MEMYQVRYFVALAKTLNFTQAARDFNVTQPALTRAIQNLEAELGGPLIRRERLQSHLTDLGQLLLPRLQALHAEAASAKLTARRFLKMEEAPLTVCVMCTVGPLRFTGFLARFRADCPGAELKLVECVPNSIEARLLAGELDLAIMATPGSYDDRFKVLPLYREGFLVALPPGHPFERKQGISLSELKGENYLERASCEFRHGLADMCRELGFELHRVYSSDREDWVQTMVAGGLGIALLPEHIVMSPGLMTRPITDPPVAREVSLVSVRHRAYSPVVRNFMDAVARHPWLNVPRGRRADTSDETSRPWWHRAFHLDAVS